MIHAQLTSKRENGYAFKSITRPHHFEPYKPLRKRRSSDTFSRTSSAKEVWSRRDTTKGKSILAGSSLKARCFYALAVLRLTFLVHMERQGLRDLDADTLRDLGIARSAAAYEAGRRFWDLPKDRLEALKRKYGFNTAKRP